MASSMWNPLWKTLLQRSAVQGAFPFRCSPVAIARNASTHHNTPADPCSPTGHGKDHHADKHSHGHGHGHDDHHHDPYETWYEEPPTNLIFRNSRLKWPFYISYAPIPTYRAPPPPHPFMERVGYTLGIILWWWILWGCLDEPGHVTGEFYIPNRSDWTDEELGIPPA